MDRRKEAVSMNNTVDYEQVVRQLLALTENVPYEVANLANISALLWQELPGINWVGFYKIEDDCLVLGPFQGKPACIRIPVGRGVCGAAVAADNTWRRAAAVNACASWAIIVTPMGTARYRRRVAADNACASRAIVVTPLGTARCRSPGADALNCNL